MLRVVFVVYIATGDAGVSPAVMEVDSPCRTTDATGDKGVFVPNSVFLVPLGMSFSNRLFFISFLLMANDFAAKVLLFSELRKKNRFDLRFTIYELRLIGGGNL